jgi:hypothetical protein
MANKKKTANPAIALATARRDALNRLKVGYKAEYAAASDKKAVNAYKTNAQIWIYAQTEIDALTAWKYGA